MIFHRIGDAADHIISIFGKEITLATPLGLGKPNALLNLLYEKAKSDPALRLNIYTGLSLNPPRPSSDLAQRFLDPFRMRHWGENYPDLEYAKDGVNGKLPSNVNVHEFYFQAGSALHSQILQRNYQSINYTHVAETIFQSGVRMVLQLIAKDSRSSGVRYSLSSNPDVTLDLVDLYKKGSKPLLVVGVVHPDLPFLGGDAEVDANFFDVIVEDPAVNHQLFALPRLPVREVDHLIGFYASQLVPDDGTLQIGIGSLSDAVVSSLVLRHRNHSLYSELIEACYENHASIPGLNLEKKPFEHGLYGLSELVTDGYMHLRRAGILKRYVIDERSGVKTYLHGAFFLGSKEFYSWLHSLEGDEYRGIRMTRVSKVNDLYDPHELTLRLQRKNPRFLNTCMQVTLLGGAASDTLEDGRVVSGVGGQYNFVSMSQELQNSRSILMVRSTRTEKGKRRSNIVWSHGHLTIPRHLRDIVITEYGIADLRGKTDEETICALLNITDSEFQKELSQIAKKNGKLAHDYEIPKWARMNMPEKVQHFISLGRKKGAFKAFPMGSDFTPEEEKIILALERLRGSSTLKLVKSFLRSFYIDSSLYQSELKRMNLNNPCGFKQRLARRLLLAFITI